MPEENIPKNLPTEGKSLLDDVGGALPEESKKEASPAPPADVSEAEDIFANVAESGLAAGPSLKKPRFSPKAGGTEVARETTVVESPRQGFKKILVTIGLIVIFTAILTGGGYFAYNQFLKPAPLSPNLNLDTNASLPASPQPAQPAQPPVAVEPPVLDGDNDGLSNEKEVELGTNPANPDTDGDLLFDREEVEVYKTDPLIKDTDGDGYEDGAEVQAGYDPKGPGKLIKIPAGE